MFRARRDTIKFKINTKTELSRLILCFHLDMVRRRAVVLGRFFLGIWSKVVIIGVMEEMGGLRFGVVRE